ncbi:MAG: glycosyltransferase family 2 protein [Paludibacteraceae bacterium]|nr:glycosyltransferase family 2 protein [Paludibacteraceae bacterium]
MAKNYCIIIPHHNTPDLLARCVSSIPEREDIDVLVIDDNSEAKYAQQITDICKQRSNITFIPTKEGLGAGFARNVGLKKAHSKWILFADADDYFLPDAWQYLDRHLNDIADIIFFHSTCRFSDTNEPGNRHIQLVSKIDAFINNPNEKNEGILRFRYDEPWGKMIRTDMILNNRLSFEQTRWANDLHFSSLIGAHAKTIAADKHEIYCVTIAKGSLVHQHSLESRRCRYEVILRNNAYLRQIGKQQFQNSLMYSLKWAAKLGGLKAVWEFIQIGRKYNANFFFGAGSWIRNFFISRNDYKNKDKYIIKQ